MPNIATILKEEITRIARREIRTETEALKKSSAQYRSEIAALKRRITTLEQQCARLGKQAAKQLGEKAVAEPTTSVRFSAKRLRALRLKLELSAQDLGALLGVSSATIYNWETEKTRPSKAQVVAIAALRGVGKREVRARVESLG